jgi:2-iminoacetate synthase ThiH
MICDTSVEQTETQAGTPVPPRLGLIQDKVLGGERIAPEEALRLYRALTLPELGALADAVRQRKHPNRVVTYIIDRNINYTNICNVYCTFCAFMRNENDADAYVLTPEQVGEKIKELVAIGGVQVLMQGGHHPKLDIDYYLDLLQHIRRNFPQVNIHGFSPPEFNHFAEVFKMPLEEVIRRFKEAGLGSIPGGGGEILVDRVRNRIAPLKCNSDEWLRVMEIAHGMGLNSSATMMLATWKPSKSASSISGVCANCRIEHTDSRRSSAGRFRRSTRGCGRRRQGRTSICACRRWRGFFWIISTMCSQVG